MAQESPDSTSTATGHIPEALLGGQLIISRMPGQNPASEIIVFHSDKLTVDDQEFQEVIVSIANQLRSMMGIVVAVKTYYETASQGLPDADAYVSHDRHSSFTTVTFAAAVGDLISFGEDYLTTLNQYETDSIRVMTIGGLSIAHALLAATSLEDPCGPAGTLAFLPDDDLKDAYRTLIRDFSTSQSGEPAAMVTIVIDGSSTDPSVLSGIDTLKVALSLDSRVGEPTQTGDDAGDLTVLDIPLAIDPCSPEAFDLVSRLRATVIPAAFSGAAAKVYVTGETATSLDAANE